VKRSLSGSNRSSRKSSRRRSSRRRSGDDDWGCTYHREGGNDDRDIAVDCTRVEGVGMGGGGGGLTGMI
jgi:hypothetical protein